MAKQYYNFFARPLPQVVYQFATTSPKSQVTWLNQTGTRLIFSGLWLVFERTATHQQHASKQTIQWKAKETATSPKTAEEARTGTRLVQ